MKIDMLYSFSFNGPKLKGAIRRLKTSISSIINQDVRICVCNTSNKCIWKDIKDLGDMRYIHKPSGKDFCKGLTINFGVKNLVQTPYFLLSDVDLVYPQSYVQAMLKYASISPNRVVPFNYNLMNRTLYSSNFEDYRELINKRYADPFRTFYGIAPGNGLVHTKTFYMLRGFNEDLMGYNIEDAEFNERCKYINNYLEISDPRIRTVHLFHSKPSECFVQTGHLNWLRKKLQIEVGEYDFWNKYSGGSIGERQKRLYWLVANKGKDWGVI